MDIGVYEFLGIFGQAVPGRTIQSCWKADALRRRGLTRRVAWNRKHPNRTVKPCPPSILPVLNWLIDLWLRMSNH